MDFEDNSEWEEESLNENNKKITTETFIGTSKDLK